MYIYIYNCIVYYCTTCNKYSLITKEKKLFKIVDFIPYKL